MALAQNSAKAEVFLSLRSVRRNERQFMESLFYEVPFEKSSK